MKFNLVNEYDTDYVAHILMILKEVLVKHISAIQLTRPEIGEFLLLR